MSPIDLLSRIVFRHRNRLLRLLARASPDYRGVTAQEPGHYYSSLLSISDFENESIPPFDGEAYWEGIDLREAGQRENFASLLPYYDSNLFPENAIENRLYYGNNPNFGRADALLLAAIIQHFRPKRIVEIGSGFSSRAMLDVLSLFDLDCKITIVDPYSEGLEEAMAKTGGSHELIQRRVQEVSVERFTELQTNDILFVDSSHVAKVGSDVAHLFLRILPALKPGVLIHLHDIFYPESYPIAWLKAGRSWNESILLRCFLQFNREFEVFAFHNYAMRKFPGMFESVCPLDSFQGGSFWMRRCD